MHIDEARPVFVFEVRPEWLKGRGRYFLPKGAGYTNDLSRAGLWVQVPNSTLMQDPDGTGPTYPATDAKFQAVVAKQAFKPFAEFVARVRAAAQREGEARHPAGASETPPEGVTPPSGPVALAHDRFWSYDGDSGIEWHDTEDEARHAAAEALDYARDESGDGWPDWVEHICWGEVRGCVVQTESKHRDEYEAEGDEAMVSRMERHGWDTIDDYALVDATPPSGPDPVADLQRRLADAELRVALWSGAPVEGWENGRGGRFVRSRGVLAVYLTFPVNEGDPWGWEATCRGRTVTDGSDPDPLVCLRAAEAWLSEVGNG